ncbi:hypothetical protein Q5W88_01215 [Shouchella clausii]|uniref:hypothetical protein n=1 Tax=Shouchella clausii TaxID=79880 RepID=UPI0026F441FE|nr:hypothetical protein [Shouchella clausii]MDO7281752.1 hypothetical protein [Shouchella clausii]MDO7301847.1 hypothetical protein [Shouchella clausii]
MIIKINQEEIAEETAFDEAIDKLVSLMRDGTIEEFKTYDVENMDKINNTYTNYTVALYNNENQEGEPVRTVTIEIYGEEDNQTIEIDLGE